jgi:phosphate-selective porin OprO/OprP
MAFSFLNIMYNMARFKSLFHIRVQALLLASIFIIPFPVLSQVDKKVVPDGTEGESFVIPEQDTSSGKKKDLPWNEFDLGFTTLKLGVGFLYEYAAFSQDEDGKAQMDSAGVTLDPAFKVRDFRFLVSGRFKTKRTITWKAAFMYDGSVEEWYVRDSGIIIGVPELSSHVFIGRTKEGFSLNKVMNGYSGWTMERQMALDVIPILADGVKWFGFLPKSRILWNIGAYADWFSEGQGFSKFNWQFAARVGWMPFYDEKNGKLLHIAANYRYGDPLNGQIRLRSKPEADPAPYFIDTGNFESDHSNHYGGEIYYRAGPFMLGSEFYLHSFSSVQADNPGFFGAEIGATYVFTGESRPYTSVGSIFGFVPVDNPLFDGGSGAWEAVLRVSTLDLDSGNLQGGKFWRVTPGINWYPTKNFRLALEYGYGVLDRFDLKGATHFFQSRIQMGIL